MKTSGDPQHEFGVERLITFSDAVFAIAVTLLVLDLREPAVSHGLLHALLRQWPAYLSYALSFLIVGIIWVQNHLMFRYIRRVDHLFLLINVLFLMWVAVVPFPTGLLARYLENPGERETATVIYAGIFLVGGLLVNLQWYYASRWGQLLEEGLTREKIRTMTLNYGLGPALYLVDLVLSFISPVAGVALICLINVFYAISPLLGRLFRRLV